MSRMKDQYFADKVFEERLAKQHFDGKTYDPAQDQRRLGNQAAAVFELVANTSKEWWALREISDALGYPESSISARLRDFRKPRFGSHTVERRRRKDGYGTWEYRLKVNSDD